MADQSGVSDGQFAELRRAVLAKVGRNLVANKPEAVTTVPENNAQQNHIFTRQPRAHAENLTACRKRHK